VRQSGDCVFRRRKQFFAALKVVLLKYGTAADMVIRVEPRAYHIMFNSRFGSVLGIAARVHLADGGLK